MGEIVTAAFLNTNIRDNGNFVVAVPLFRGRQTVAQSIPNSAFTSILLDSEDIDTDNGHSTSSNTSRYVGQTAGWYQVSGGVGFTANATGVRAVALALNGTVFAGGQGNLSAPTTAAFTCSIASRTESVQLNGTTDYLEIQGLQSSGGALNTLTNTADQSTLDVRWIHN